MASRINADSSNGLQLVSDSSGEVQIQSNGVTVATINSSGLSMNSGTLAGNGPAFRAYLSANQSITTLTYTKINIDTETFDTDSCYDTTNKRFTPNVAGYYQVNGIMRGYGLPSTYMEVALYKNGSGYESGQIDEYSATNAGLQMNISTIVYLNGTTDYIELYGRIVGTTPAFQVYSSIMRCWFSAALVRAA